MWRGFLQRVGGGRLHVALKGRGQEGGRPTSIAGGRDQATSVSQESPGGIPAARPAVGFAELLGGPTGGGRSSQRLERPAGLLLPPMRWPGGQRCGRAIHSAQLCSCPRPGREPGPPGSRSRLQSSPAAGRKQGRHTTMSLTRHGPRLRRALCARSLHSQVSDFQPTPPG